MSSVLYGVLYDKSHAMIYLVGCPFVQVSLLHLSMTSSLFRFPYPSVKGKPLCHVKSLLGGA